MLRTATVRGWQPHTGVLSRACLATLLRVLMMGMLASEEKENEFHFIRTRQQGSRNQSKKSCFCLFVVVFFLRKTSTCTFCPHSTSLGEISICKAQ